MKNILKVPSISFSPALRMWATGVVLFIICFRLLYTEQLNLVVALLFGGALLFIYFQNKLSVIPLTFTYLLILGDLRRISGLFTGTPALDFLLLIGPAAAVLLAMPLLLQLKVRDSLSKAMLAIMAMMILQIFNPRQGGLSIGLSGGIFYIVPVLWFWIGRQYGTPRIVEQLIYKFLLPLAVLSALLGFYQTFVGFLPYEQIWIDSVKNTTYTSLNLGGAVRAFGFSVSGAEYAETLAFCSAAAAAAWFGRKRAWTLAFPLLLVGMFLASGRTVVVKLVLSLAVVWTMRNRRRFTTFAAARLIVFGVGGLFAISAVAARFAPDAEGGGGGGKKSAVSEAIAHQAGGLAHPTDSKYSTAAGHTSMFTDGLVRGFTYPIGSGLGATTNAATKFGTTSDLGSSEIDLSDMFIDLGFVGGFLYLYFFYGACRNAFRYVYYVPLTISLPTLGILITEASGWLKGGQYSTSAIMFFLIGSITREQMIQDAKKTAEVKKAPALRPTHLAAAQIMLPERNALG